MGRGPSRQHHVSGYECFDTPISRFANCLVAWRRTRRLKKRYKIRISGLRALKLSTPRISAFRGDDAPRKNGDAVVIVRRK